MKQYDVKCLNKRILEAMDKNVPENIERLDNDGFEYMMYELVNEDLSILTFEALADIYKAEYKFTLMYGNPNSMTITTLNEKDILWSKLYEIYKLLKKINLVKFTRFINISNFQPKHKPFRKQYLQKEFYSNGFLPNSEFVA